MIPDSTSPLPAVANDGTPAPASSTSGAPEASGAATAVSGPLSRTTAPVAAASRRAASRRSGPGADPAMRGVLAVVRVRMLGALRLSSRVRAAPASPSAVSASASITNGPARRHARPGSPRPPPSPVPSPGPITTALHLAIPSKKAPAQPSRGQVHPHCLGRPRRGGVAGRAQPDHAGARRHGAAGAQDGRALHPGRAGRHADGVRPLVDLARPRAAPTRATSASSTSIARGTREADADVGHLDDAAQARALALEQPRLQAAKVTVASARTASPGAAPVSASTPEGMSMASTRAPAGTAGAS